MRRRAVPQPGLSGRSRHELLLQRTGDRKFGKNRAPPASGGAAAPSTAGAEADAPYAVDGRVSLEKIFDVLDSAAGERAEQLAGRMWVRTSPAERPDVLTAVEQELPQRRMLVMRYRDRLSRLSHRRVESHLLARIDVRAWFARCGAAFSARSPSTGPSAVLGVAVACRTAQPGRRQWRRL